MTERLILFLPHAAALSASNDMAAVPVRGWARLSGGRIVASGGGDDDDDAGRREGWRDRAGAADSDDAGGEGGGLPPVVAIVSAADAPIRFVQYDHALPVQAAAAARIDALKQVLGDRADVHIAAAMPASTGQAFAVAVTQHSAMAAWTAWLSAHDIVAEAIMPAALIVPPPEGEALVAADVGGERIMRSAAHGYAGDPAIDALMSHGAEWQEVSRADIDVGLAFAAQNVPLDLLTGAWKVKQGWQVDAGLMRWIKRLAAGLILLSLAVVAVQMLRLNADRARADEAVLETTRGLGISADDAADAEAQMDRRLAEKAGGPLAFSVPASALYAVLAEAPAVSLQSLSHRGDGTVTAMLAAARVEDLNPVLISLQARGYRITAQPMAGRDGQQMANVTIRAVP